MASEARNIIYYDLKKSFSSNTIFRNFSYLTIGAIISQLVSLLAILKITRILSPDNYGLFSFLIVQGMLLYTIADLGLKHVVIRSVARDSTQSNNLFFNGAILKSFALLLVMSLYVLYNFMVGNLSTNQLSLIFAFSFVNCLSNLFENIFFGQERMLAPAALNICYSLMWLAAVYLTPVRWMSATTLFLVFVCLNSFKAIAGFFILKSRNFLSGPVHSFVSTSKKLLAESWPYFVLVLIMLPFTMLPSNFLDLNSTVEQVGFLNLSQKLLGPISIVMDIALASIFPNLSALWLKDKSRFKEYVEIGFTYYILLTLMLCFFFAMFAPDIVAFLFPGSYQVAVEVSQVYVWYIFLALMDSLIGTILSAVNREKLILKFALIKMVFCAPFLFYGSKFGALGISYASVISVAFFQFFLWFVFIKAIKIKIKHSEILWGLSVIVFLITLFSVDFSFLFKCILSGIVGIPIASYILRTYRARTQA